MRPSTPSAIEKDIHTHRERTGSEDSSKSIAASDWSEETLTESQPQSPQLPSPHHSQRLPLDSRNPSKLQDEDASSQSNELGQQNVAPRLRGAVRRGWQRFRRKKLTVQASYLFVVNITLLVIGILTLLTSDQPTSVDFKSLAAENQALKMQKALLENSVAAAKTSKQTLNVTRGSLEVEQQSLELQRAALEKDTLELEVQKQTLELAKWSAYHEYIVGCAAYAQQKITSERCAEALKAFDQPPPYLPDDHTLALSKRWLRETSDQLGTIPVKTQDVKATFTSNFAANVASQTTIVVTSSIASPPSLNPVAPTGANSDQAGLNSGILAILGFALAISVSLFLLWWCPKTVRWITADAINVTGADEEIFKAKEKDLKEARDLEPVPVPSQSLSVTQGNRTPLPVGLRNRKDNTRQLTAKRDIWAASFHGDTTAVHELLGDGGLNLINKVHATFGTPLQAAAQGGHLKVAKIFLNLKVDPNIYGGRLHSPLQAAAYSGDLQLVKILLSSGANVNATGGSCGSAFLAAVERGCVAMVQSLIDVGADIHLTGGIYGNALQIAAFRGSEYVVSLLLNRRASVNLISGCYDTALLASTMEGHTSIVRLLLDHQADVNYISKTYGSALQVACRQDHFEIASLLVEKGADSSVRDEQKRMPLHEAARNGRISLSQSLLERGALCNLPDIDGWTPLHHAALNGHDRIVKLLLDQGADVSARDKFGAEPLFRACDLGLGFVRTVKLLLDAGADVNACDKYGRAALHCPAADENVEVHRLLIANGALLNMAGDDGQRPLHRAIDAGNRATLKLLIEAGAEINLQDNDQATALHIAVSKGFDELAFLLLQQPDIDINARSASAFQEAIARNSLPLVKAMLAKGAALNAQGSRYGGVVQAAACANSLPIFKILLDRKANINVQGGEFGSALNAAAYHCRIEMANILLEHGANPYIKGGRFGYVLSSARKSKASARLKDEMVRLLKSYGAEEPPNDDMPHEHDRWVLTPGGWVWLPEDSL